MSVKITNNTNQVFSEIDDAIKNALEDMARQCEHHARQDYVPVDTGRLKNSIQHDVKGYTARIGSDVEYAGYVEFGTSKMTARKYLRRALENHLQEYGEILIKHLRGK